MEEIGRSMINGHSNAGKKRRSLTSRRPLQPFAESPDPADDLSKVSSDDNAGSVYNFRRKECDIHYSSSLVSSTEWVEAENSHKKSNHDRHYNSIDDSKHPSKVAISSVNFKSLSKVKDGQELESSSSLDVYGGRNGECTTSGNLGLSIDQLGNDNKVKKVKFKVGGVITRTIQAYSANGDSVAKPSLMSSHSPEATRQQQKQNFQENLDDNYHSDRKNGLRGIPWKDFSRSGFSLGRDDFVTGKISASHSSGKQDSKSESVRKRECILKKHMLHGESGNDDEDDEIRYLEKFKTSMAAPGCKEDDEGSGKKHRKLSSISKMEDVGLSRLRNDVKMSKSLSIDTEYEEEIELSSDGDLGDKNKKQKNDSVEVIEGKREMKLTRRQRALQLSKDASSLQGATVVEFPNGLPPASSTKQKEKLSDVDLQLKKAEAAQRRKMQVEKAARESEAVAIKKILGQDSNRKKREDKIKKRQQELAQEKAAYAKKLASNTVRWVMGPTGTVVTFPKDMGLPSIFDCKPCSYPPPRENCVGPLCSNPSKYRDSTSKLPLCSLQCYKAIEEKLAQTTY